MVDKRRLGMLREALQDAIKVKAVLNMEEWVSDPVDSNKVEGLGVGYHPSTVEAHDCGTVCCIAGWGGCHRGLQAEGLSLVSEDSVFILELRGCSEVYIPSQEDPDDDDLSLAVFFGLTDDQAQALFSDFTILEDWYGGDLQDAVREYRDGEKMTLEVGISVIDKILAEKT